MSTLAETENAVKMFSILEKEKLLPFLATRLRGERQKIPLPRCFGRDQLRAWIVEDESSLGSFANTHERPSRAIPDRAQSDIGCRLHQTRILDHGE